MHTLSLNYRKPALTVCNVTIKLPLMPLITEIFKQVMGGLLKDLN